MANLKIGGAHNEAGQKFFASNLLTTENETLFWNNNILFHSKNFTISNDFTGTGTAESPLKWNGLSAQGNTGSSLASNIKTLKAGENVSLEAENGVLTINASGGGEDVDLSDAVLRYPATVDPESKVVTITDGTPVTEVRIGDEIVTPQGVYQKVKDSITTGDAADGSHIAVSGSEGAAPINGTYTLQSENLWKHESENYWLFWSDTGNWCLAGSHDSSINPGNALFYAPADSSAVKPWEASPWMSGGGGGVGIPVLENVASEQIVTNTLDLFEYASLPLDPVNIVQSVNGNKPDSSGNVTVEVTGAVDAEFFETGDYNDFTEPGIYYISGYYGECPNAPDNYSYMLRVEKAEETNFSRIFQIANRYVDSDDDDKQAIFIRNGYRESEGDEIIWNSWQSLSSGGGSITTPPPLMFTVPSSDSGLHLEITAGKLADGTDNAALINTSTSADHRAKVLGNSGGTDWIACPDTGFGTNFAGWPVKVDVTGLLDPSGISYIRYRWVPTTGDPSDWYAMVYPCATEAPVLSPGGSSGDTTELENRVSDLEETVGSLNSTVDEILADYGEGTGALVYRVVASATEPENPTEGMIWIQTE